MNLLVKGKGMRIGAVLALAAATTFMGTATSSAGTLTTETDTVACREGLASISTETGVTCFEGKGIWSGAIPGVISIRGGASDWIAVNINDDCCTAAPNQVVGPITPHAFVQEVQLF